MTTRGRRRAIARMGSLAMLLAAPRLVFGAAIVGVRIWPAPDYTRVTIESDQALASVKQNADAIKSLPIIRGYVVDPERELIRPTCKRVRWWLAQ